MSDPQKSISILIVDDSPSDRRIYHRFLKNFNWNVCDAATGEEGIAACQNRAFDCILLDYRMPGPNGVSLLPRFREITKAPIILLTGEPDPLIVTEAYRLGVDSYLNKELVSSETLREKIESLIQDF